MPSASAARCGLVTALVKIRKPRENPAMESNSSAGHSGMPAATSVIAADLVMRIGARDVPQRAQRLDLAR